MFYWIKKFIKKLISKEEEVQQIDDSQDYYEVTYDYDEYKDRLEPDRNANLQVIVKALKRPQKYLTNISESSINFCNDLANKLDKHEWNNGNLQEIKTINITMNIDLLLCKLKNTEPNKRSKFNLFNPVFNDSYDDKLFDDTFLFYELKANEIEIFDSNKPEYFKKIEYETYIVIANAVDATGNSEFAERLLQNFEKKYNIVKNSEIENVVEDTEDISI